MTRAMFILFAVSLLAARAHAQDGDGVYGRFDATTSVVVAAGASLDAPSGDLGAVVDVRVRVLESAGLVAALHTEHPGRARLFTGLELRPLFPALFLQQFSTGRAYLDLFVQSLSIELGVDIALERPVPIGFAWGLSMEVPLVRPDRFAHGLGLRFGARHTRFFSDGRPGGVLADDTAWSGYLLLALGFDAGQAVANWEPVRHRER